MYPWFRDLRLKAQILGAPPPPLGNSGTPNSFDLGCASRPEEGSILNRAYYHLLQRIKLQNFPTDLNNSFPLSIDMLGAHDFPNILGIKPSLVRYHFEISAQITADSLQPHPQKQVSHLQIILPPTPARATYLCVVIVLALFRFIHSHPLTAVV